MAEQQEQTPEKTRTVLIAIDGSKHAEFAFECRYFKIAAVYFMFSCSSFVFHILDWGLLYRIGLPSNRATSEEAYD